MGNEFLRFWIVELLQKLQQEDAKHAQEIRQHLQAVMQKGKM
jgi:hypothetical protein